MKRFLIGMLLIGLSGCEFTCDIRTEDRTHTYIEFGTRSTTEQASFLLELGPDDRIEEVASILSAYGASYERAFPTLSLEMDEDLAQIYLVYGDPATFDDLMAALRADAENVDFTELNLLVSLEPPIEGGPLTPDARRTYLENDPLAPSQWGLKVMRSHEALALLRDLTPARKAVVAIIDTGVDQQHEDLRRTFKESPGSKDGEGHGTHCAGIAGAVTNNHIGIASLNWNGAFVDVAGYQALKPDRSSFSGSFEDVAQAVIDAARDGADVISMSLGGRARRPPKVLVDAIEFAQRRGAIAVAAAGNGYGDAYNHFPSNIDGVIAVAAVDQKLKKADFSNTVTSLSRPLAAPGVDILSLAPKNAYKIFSGTSMATPMVSGLLGVMRALHPDLTAEEAYTILHETGTVVEDSPQVGRVVNAEAAIRAVTARP